MKLIKSIIQVKKADVLKPKDLKIALAICIFKSRTKLMEQGEGKGTEENPFWLPWMPWYPTLTFLFVPLTRLYRRRRILNLKGYKFVESC